MDFRLTPDQDSLVSAIDKIAVQFESMPTGFHGFALKGADLERELQDGEYFDIAQIPELGPLAAAMVVEEGEIGGAHLLDSLCDAGQQGQVAADVGLHVQTGNFRTE